MYVYIVIYIVYIVIYTEACIACLRKRKFKVKFCHVMPLFGNYNRAELIFLKCVIFCNLAQNYSRTGLILLKERERKYIFLNMKGSWLRNSFVLFIHCLV